MVVVHDQCWLGRLLPVPTRRSICIMFVLVLAAQTIWYSQFYRHIVSRSPHSLTNHQTTKSVTDERSSHLDTMRGHSQFTPALNKMPLVRDDRQLHKAGHEFKIVGPLQMSLRTENRSLVTRQLKVVPPGPSLGTRQLKDVPPRPGLGTRQLKDIPPGHDWDVERLPNCGGRGQRSVLHAAMLKYFTLQETDTRESFVNLHRFGYHLDAAACKEEARPDLVILVHTKFDNFVRRSLIRATWAFNRTVKGMTYRTIFLLGHPGPLLPGPQQTKPNAPDRQEDHLMSDKGAKMAAVMREIQAESAAFGDIVMGNFTDNYRNLTIKHIMALTWVITHCPQVNYVIKVDDDVMVNTFKVASYVSQWEEVGSGASNKAGLLACKISTGQHPQRRKGGKWFVSRTDYPFSLYPDWCLGYGMLMSTDVVHRLLMASRDVRSYWIDDVYVTGLLRVKAGLSLTNLPGPHEVKKALFLLRKFVTNITFVGRWQRLVAANGGPD